MSLRIVDREVSKVRTNKSQMYVEYGFSKLEMPASFTLPLFSEAPSSLDLSDLLYEEHSSLSVSVPIW